MKIKQKAFLNSIEALSNNINNHHQGHIIDSESLQSMESIDNASASISSVSPRKL